MSLRGSYEMAQAARAALSAISEASHAHPELGVPINGVFGLLAFALNRLEDLLPAPPPAPVRKPRKRTVQAAPPKPPVRLVKELPTPTKAELASLDLRPSAWDPEPRDSVAAASCCRALLLEIMRRAAYDWVLYRSSSKLQDKRLAEDAYHWLFVEEPTDRGPTWDERVAGGKQLTAFVSICEALDLDPDSVRAHIRKLTVKNVMSVGRPAERRHHPVEGEGGEELSVHGGVSLDEIPSYDPTWG